LYRIPATGGKAEQVTQQRAQDASHRFPQFLPDGHHFLFWVHGPPDVRGVYVGSLDSKEFHRICVADGAAVFVPPNHLLLVRERVLYAQRFDPAKISPRDAGNYGSLGKVNIGFCVKKSNGRMTNSCHIVGMTGQSSSRGT
jgi:hypothetical protein